MSNLSAVIFDFDGIIVDTERLHYEAFQRILVPLGLGNTWEEYLADFVGFDDRDAFRVSFERAGLPLDSARLKELLERKAQVFGEISANCSLPALPGVVSLLKSISGVLPLALCSGALMCDIEPILPRLGLDNCFDAVVAADHVEKSKPHPACYQLALSKLMALFPECNISSDSAIAIEDTPTGIAAATGAGLSVLAVANTHPIDELQAARWVAGSLSSITIDILKEWMLCDT